MLAFGKVDAGRVRDATIPAVRDEVTGFQHYSGCAFFTWASGAAGRTS